MTQVHNDHNVYVLGAGFSAEAGLPLTKDFMNRMRDARSWLPQKDRMREIKAIEHVLRFRLQAAAASYRVPLNVDNVEELFGLASATGDEKLTRDMTIAIAATIDYARAIAKPLRDDYAFDIAVRSSLNRQPPPNWKLLLPNAYNLTNVQSVHACPRYEFYLGLIGGYFNSGSSNRSDRRDTIITFNYDTVIEEALEGLGLHFVYGNRKNIRQSNLDKPQKSQYANGHLRILKIHGSVNWVDSATYNSGLVGHKNSSHPVGKNLEMQILALRSYDDVRNRGHAPLLVAPTWQKIFSGHLTTVWKQAVEALKTATRLIIIGYSLPSTDQHFKYLLAAGLKENISLRKVFFVNPDLGNAMMRKKISKRLFDIFRREHFERGVVEFVDEDTKQFFGAQNLENQGSLYKNHPGRIRIGRPFNNLPEILPGNADWFFFDHFDKDRISYK